MLFDCLLRVCGTKVCWNTSLDISYSGFGWSGHGNHLNSKNKCIIVTVWCSSRMAGLYRVGSSKVYMDRSKK